MTEIFGKEKKIEQVKVLLSSEAPNIEQIAGKNGDQYKIKEPEKTVDEIIRIKSTQDPFKFISQYKQVKSKASSSARIKLKLVHKMYRQGDLLFKRVSAFPENLKEKQIILLRVEKGQPTLTCL